jgi:hypothetical protein
MVGGADISGVDKALLVRWESMTEEERAAYVLAERTVQKHVPSRGLGLNIAQYRALKATYTLDKTTGFPPTLNIISFANGVGKTALMILDVIGWTLGPNYLNVAAFPPCAIAFYASLAKLRESGMLSLRLVCTADDMKDGGSVNMLLKEFFPFARLTAVDQMRCYRQIDVPLPKRPGVVNSIAVKTFDQAVVKHSGSTLHRVWINEPLPDELVGETIGRLRAKKGGRPGTLMMTATLLDGASWVEDLENEPCMTVNHTRGHLYENCNGPDVTDEMAAEVKRTIGVTLLKDEQKGGYITNGVLLKESIDSMILGWKTGSPHELEARKSGAPLSGGGKVYPTFNRDIHVVKDYQINPDWPIFQVADPHAARPTFTIWAQLTPQGRLFIFEEWPSARDGKNYETITERTLDIPRECETWDRIEMLYKIKNSNITRIGDPNRMADPNPYSGLTLQGEYKKHGYDFKLNVNDDLTLGHRIVSEWLFCDELRLTANPNDVGALPKLFICERCVNTIHAMRGYSFKVGRRQNSSVSENVEQKYKDPADCVRYLIMWNARQTFEQAQNKSTGSSDFRRFCEGRIPKAYKLQSSGFNINGRRRVA